MYSDEMIADLMSHAKTIAVVGLTDRPATPSYDVASYQQSQGYKVIPVNPDIDSSLGHKAVAKLDDIQEDPVDIVNVFIQNDKVQDVAQAAVQKGAKALWLQPGVHNHQAEQIAEDAGIPVITGKCFKREHQRLLSRAGI